MGYDSARWKLHNQHAREPSRVNSVDAYEVADAQSMLSERTRRLQTIHEEDEVLYLGCHNEDSKELRLQTPCALSSFDRCQFQLRPFFP